jgi:hypothetical protein
MVRWEEGDRGQGRRLGDAKETVQDRGGGAPAARLNDQRLAWSLGEERRIERLVAAGQDQARPIRSHDAGDARARPVEQRLPVHEGTELLGPLVAGNPSCQRPEPHPLAPGQDDRPPVRPLRHDVHLLLLVAICPGLGAGRV